MIRTSNRRNAGSRKNKKNKTVGTQESDTGHWVYAYMPIDDFWIQFKRWIYNRESPFTYKIKPNHLDRKADIRDCYPLAKLGH